MMNLLERFNIHFEPLDDQGRLLRGNPGFWRYLGRDMPAEPLPLIDLFDELVGREGELRTLIESGSGEVRIPGIFKDGRFFNLTILPDSEAGTKALVILEDDTASMRAQQDLVQQRNEIHLLQRDLETQNADLSIANRQLDILGRSLAERNEELNSLMQTIRTQNHDLESKIRIRTRDLRDSRLSVISKLARVAEFRDKDTGGHIYRIGRSCVLIGKKLGLGSEECETLFHVSLLHDVGKIGIPDSVLLKPAPLSREERAIIQTHTLIGAELLGGDDYRLFTLAREVARFHHEKWNGSGYPDALAGEAIPVMARICAIADVFDALMSKRPYKEAWNEDRAAQEIGKDSGISFDPEVVASFFAVIDDIVKLRQETLGSDGGAPEILPELD